MAIGGAFRRQSVGAAACGGAGWAQRTRARMPQRSGETPAPGACGAQPAPAACAGDGSTAYASWAGAYEPSEGVFTGAVTASGCPPDARAWVFDGVPSARALAAAPAPRCVAQALPAPWLSGASLPAPLPAGGGARAGVALSGADVGGPQLAAPLGAGTSAGAASLCVAGGPAARCPAGADWALCRADAERQCGSAALRADAFLSDCGGALAPALANATPAWRYAAAPACELGSNVSAASGHSALLAVMLDGRGLYGPWERGGGGDSPSPPLVLDACSGHVGFVPAATLPGGVAWAASTAAVYHYHVQAAAPFVPGCLGPAGSLAQAKAQYPACAGAAAVAAATAAATNGSATGTCAAPGGADCALGDVYSRCTALGATEYELGCPVFSQTYAPGAPPALFNQIVPSAACPACAGACPADSSAAPASLPISSTGITLIVVGLLLAAFVVFAVWVYRELNNSKPCSIGACAARCGGGGRQPPQEGAGRATKRIGLIARVVSYRGGPRAATSKLTMMSLPMTITQPG